MSSFIPSDFGPTFGANFIPNLQYVENISKAQQAVVTFTTTTNFTIGEWIGFRIPPANGMTQLNNQQAKIIGINSNQITIDLDTLGFYPFISATDPQVPCIAVPVASGIIPGTSTVTLEDAFDNEPTV